MAVAARSQLGMVIHRGSRACEKFETRVTSNWLGSMVKGGVHLVSACLCDSEGMSERNMDLLHHVAGVVDAVDGL